MKKLRHREIVLARTEWRWAWQIFLMQMLVFMTSVPNFIPTSPVTTKTHHCHHPRAGKIESPHSHSFIPIPLQQGWRDALPCLLLLPLPPVQASMKPEWWGIWSHEDPGVCDATQPHSAGAKRNEWIH